MVRRAITDRDIKAVLALEQAGGREADQEDALSSIVIATLRGGVWHTTSRDRYHAILQTGSILPEPPISDSERWGTGLGTTGCPYVRSLGGVSLFDFSDFDAEVYSNDYPVSSWREFVPYRSTWGEAIWIAAHIGSLPQRAFKRVFVASKTSRSFIPFS
jgi:hypothetical protein